MKKLGKVVLTLLSAFLITFLAGLVWGNFRARHVTTTDDAMNFVASEAGFEKGKHSRYYQGDDAIDIHTFSFACKDWDYYYLAPLEMSGKVHVPRTSFFANYDNTLTWAMFGTGLLAGKANEFMPIERRGWLLYGAFAAAAYGAVEGYRQGFNQSVDCGLIDKTLNEDRWKVISQQIEVRNKSHMPAPLVFHIVSPGITKCRAEGMNDKFSMLSIVIHEPEATCSDFAAGDLSKNLYLVFAYTGAKPNRTSVYAKMITTRLEPGLGFTLFPGPPRWTSVEIDTPKQYFSTERGIFSLPLKTEQPGTYQTTVVVDGVEAGNSTVQIPLDQESLEARQLQNRNLWSVYLKEAQGQKELQSRQAKQIDSLMKSLQGKGYRASDTPSVTSQH